jgi:lipoyl(octanoyl) transferase
MQVEVLHGLQPYPAMLERQKTLLRQRIDDAIDDRLLLLEHAPVITIPRDAAAQNLLVSEAVAAQHGVSVCRTNRGGDITYHGPGQVVAYPIVKLLEGERDVGRYVRQLEAAMIDTCAHFGVRGERVKGLTGIWVGEQKIGAIGVRFSRWTASHGLAFNVSTELSHFGLIVPCGIADRGVCSLRSLGVEAELEKVRSVLRTALCEKLGRKAAEPAIPGP